MEFDNNIEWKFLKALELIEHGEICNAKVLVQETLMEEPVYAKAHYLMAWICFAYLTDYRRAEKHVKLAIKYEPDYPNSYYAYVDILLQQDKMEELMVVVKDALKIGGIDKSFLFYKLACAKEARGDYSDAMDCIKLSKRYSTSVEWLKFIKNEKSRIYRKIGLFNHVAAFLL